MIWGVAQTISWRLFCVSWSMLVVLVSNEDVIRSRQDLQGSALWHWSTGEDECVPLHLHWNSLFEYIDMYDCVGDSSLWVRMDGFEPTMWEHDWSFSQVEGTSNNSLAIFCPGRGHFIQALYLKSMGRPVTSHNGLKSMDVLSLSSSLPHYVVPRGLPLKKIGVDRLVCALILRRPCHSCDAHFKIIYKIRLTWRSRSNNILVSSVKWQPHWSHL